MNSYLIANTISLAALLLTLLVLYAFGRAFITAIKKLVTLEKLRPTVELSLVLASGFSAVALLFKGLSEAFSSLTAAAWVLTSGASALLFFFRRTLVNDVSKAYDEFAALWREGERWQKVFAVSVLFVMALCYTETFLPQTHGDPYLYHLRVGQLWTSSGSTGVDLLNITTGYSWAVELIYAWIYQFTGTGLQHILLAQKVQGFFSFLVLQLFIYRILREFLSRPYALSLLGLFATPFMTQMVFLAKNDGISFLWVVIAYYLATNRAPRWLICCSPWFLTAKITAAVSLAIVGLAHTLSGCFVGGYQFLRRLSTWGLAGCFSILGILPFLIQNYRATGNPTFPLMNQIFGSPYGPKSAQSIVTEMAPFSLTWSSFWQGSWQFCVEHPILVLAPVVILMAFVRQKKPTEPLILLLVIGVTSLGVFQYVLAPYHGAIEQRHFKLASFFITLGVCCGIPLVDWPKVRFIILLACTGLGISHLSIEVKISQALKSFASFDLFEDLKAKKPTFRVLDHLMTRADFCLDCGILDLSQHGWGYLVTRGRYLHPKVTSQLMVPTEVENLSDEYLDSLVTRGVIQYALLDDTSSYPSTAAWVQSKMSLVFQSGFARLYQATNLPTKQDSGD
jgi:hypothetical protein